MAINRTLRTVSSVSISDHPTLGKLCIEVTAADKIAFISETLCIGCGICPKVGLNIVTLLSTVFPVTLYHCFHRNVRLKPSQSSTYQATWRRTPLIATVPTPSSFIASLHRDPEWY